MILSHIALLVPSVDKSAAYLTALGYVCGPAEEFESDGTKEVYVGDYQNQTGLLLLLQAIGDGPYKRAWQKRGPSLHHIALDVLDLNEFVTGARGAGWQLHPVSQGKTAWLFHSGLPLIEAHERKILSDKPLQITELQFPQQTIHKPALQWILGKHLSFGGNLSLLIDGKALSFSQIACLS